MQRLVREHGIWYVLAAKAVATANRVNNTRRDLQLQPRLSVHGLPPVHHTPRSRAHKQKHPVEHPSHRRARRAALGSAWSP